MFADPGPDLLGGSPAKPLSVVGETNKRDAVWRRLGELASHMRSHGVAEIKILSLLSFHTPGQIELGFKTLSHVHPDAVADVILKGRFGYRAGIKANKAPPNLKPTIKLLAEQRKKETRCPPVTQDQRRALLDQYLSRLPCPE